MEKTIFPIILLILVVLAPLTQGNNTTLNVCYLKFSSPVTLEYSFENVSAKTIILDISSLEYQLKDNGYIIISLGYPPLNLYGFAILYVNNTTNYYSIRGDQNHWHLIRNNISGNVIVRIDIYNHTLVYELLSNGLIIDSYKTNIALNSLDLRNLVLAIGSPYGSSRGWFAFRELTLTADNNVIVSLLPDNNTLTEIKEEDLAYPNTDNIRILCIKPVTLTKTITYNYTSTITVSPNITILEVTKTYTTTIYTTLVTSIVETKTNTITSNSTIILTSTTTNTITLTTTSTLSVERQTVPFGVYVLIIVLVLIIIALIALILRK